MINIVGRGNVASHLYKALKDKTEVAMINPHTLEGLSKDADLIILAVTDNAIKEVAEKIPATKGIVVHTSGSTDIDELSSPGRKTGVFYPLQTFTKNTELDYSLIPIFVEGSSEEVVKELKAVASLISGDVREADSNARRNLHLASVFACNFTNAMAKVAKDILQDSGISFSALIPLMRQTVDKLEKMTPEDAQTGPAIRKDNKVIKKHLDMLSDSPEIRTIYNHISNLISNAKI